MIRLTALRSDHIAPVLKFGTFNDFPCLILPYFKNGSLKGKRFSPEIIKGMIVPCLLDGLKFLHENNILHKDIKPSNLMLSDDGKNVLIIDFGISSSFEAGQSVLVTKTGMSPEYSAPETFNNVFLKESDYYSLGITLYELVTGSTPFSNSSFSSDELAIMASINAVPFPEEFPSDLKELITGLTYKDLSNRDDPSNPNRRWTAPEVEKWLKGIRQNIPGRDSVSVSRQSEPQANSPAGSDEDQISFVKPYYFSDRLGRPQILHNISEFAEAFGQNWKDGKSHIGRGKVSEFFGELGIQIFEILSQEYEEESEKDELSDLSYFTFLLSIQGSCREKFFYWKDHRYQTMDELGQYCFDTFTAASSSGSAAKSRKKKKSDPNKEKSSEFSQITEAIKLWYLQNEQNDELKFFEKYQTLCQTRSFDLRSSSILLCSFLMKTFPVRIRNSVYDSPDDFFSWFDTQYRDDRNAALSWLSENENGINLYSLCFNQHVAEKMKKLLKALDVYRKKMEEERRIQEEEARRQEEERLRQAETVRQAEKARKKREKQERERREAEEERLRLERDERIRKMQERKELFKNSFFSTVWTVFITAGILAAAVFYFMSGYSFNLGFFAKTVVWILLPLLAVGFILGSLDGSIDASTRKKVRESLVDFVVFLALFMGGGWVIVWLWNILSLGYLILADIILSIIVGIVETSKNKGEDGDGVSGCCAASITFPIIIAIWAGLYTLVMMIPFEILLTGLWELIRLWQI